MSNPFASDKKVNTKLLIHCFLHEVEIFTLDLLVLLFYKFHQMPLVFKNTIHLLLYQKEQSMPTKSDHSTHEDNDAKTQRVCRRVSNETVKLSIHFELYTFMYPVT